MGFSVLGLHWVRIGIGSRGQGLTINFVWRVHIEYTYIIYAILVLTSLTPGECPWTHPLSFVLYVLKSFLNTFYFVNDAVSVIDYVLPDHHWQLYVILSLVVHLVIFKLFTEFLGILKKEDPNNEENVLSEIKIDEKEEPVGKNVPSDNLEMSDLSSDSISEKNQEEGDSDPETRKLGGKMF